MIANLVFKNCGGNGPLKGYSYLYDDFHIEIIAAVFFSTCYCCNVTDVTFTGYGLALTNLLGESYLGNITLHLRATKHSLRHWCNQGIKLRKDAIL